MDTSLSISDIESLVAEHAGQIDHAITRDRIHVYEDPDSIDGDSLIVQIAAKRPEDLRKLDSAEASFLPETP